MKQYILTRTNFCPFCHEIYICFPIIAESSFMAIWIMIKLTNDALKHWYMSSFDNLRSNLLVVWLTLPFSKSHKMFQNWEEATFYLFMLTPTWLLQHLQESENSTIDQESVLTSAIWKYIKKSNWFKWHKMKTKLSNMDLCFFTYRSCEASILIQLNRHMMIFFGFQIIKWWYCLKDFFYILPLLSIFLLSSAINIRW